MTIKYHINSRGNLNLCKAKTLESCKFKRIGLKTHFSEETYKAAKFWLEKDTFAPVKQISLSELQRFITNNPDKNSWIIKPISDTFSIEDIELTSEENKVKKVIFGTIEQYYSNGLGLKGTILKNYTSGDHGGEGFEKMVEKCIHKVADFHSVEDYKIEQDYFRPTLGDGDLDSMRLDQHVWVKGKLVALIENRAWIDKPFYSLKRNVVQCFEKLPHTKRHLTDKTEFLFLGLNIDITNRLIKTQDLVAPAEHKIHIIPLSNGRRNYKGKNYFDNGINEIAVKHFARFLNNMFKT